MNNELFFAPNISSDWKLVPNKYLFISHSEKVGENFSNYQLLSLTKKGVVAKDINSNEGKLPASFEGYQTVSKGDMIFCLFDLDMSAVFSGLSDMDGMITSAYDVYAVNDKLIDSNYCKYWFDYVFTGRYYKNYSKNIRYTVGGEAFGQIKTPIPSLEEQKKIGDFLDKKINQIDELISNQEKQIEKLEEYKQSIITKAVTKGLDPNVKMKGSGVEWIGEIPEGWEIKPLKSYFDFSKGLPITKENLTETGVKVISYGQIHAKYNKSVTIDDRLYRYVSDTYLTSNPECLVKKYDFIIADTSEDRKGTGDFIHIDNDDKIFAGYHSIILRNKYDVYSYYFAYLFMSDPWRNQFRCKVGGVKLFSLTQKILSTGLVIVPPLSEQKEIVNQIENKCTSIDSLIEVKKEKIEKLETFKKSIIYECVTGKKKVA